MLIARIKRDFFGFLCSIIASSLLASSLCAEFIPAGDFRMLGGQYFFNSDPSSLSGNLSLTYVPSVKVNDKLSIIPTYLGTYQGTQEVNDLAGGGTLFHDGLNHLVSVKAVYALLPTLKVKAGGSYRLEYLRETKNETWGKGLFDYTKLNFGFEAEYEYLRSHSVRVGLDSYALRFPNYESLESSAAASGLGREQAGKNTLDCNNLMTTVRFNSTFGRVKTEAGFITTAKNYPDQPLILADNTYSATKRSDTYTIISANASCPFKTLSWLQLVPDLDIQYVTNVSNQNHYDAAKLKFVPDYYAYTETVLSPTVHCIVGSRPWAVSFSVSMAGQNYKERLVQDAGGNYSATSEKIRVDETIYTV